jgi:PAS domain S-box-containing protein
VTDQEDAAIIIERYDLITREMSDGVYDWDVSANSLYVSDRLNELFDFETGALTSEAWAERVHPSDMAIYSRAIRDHFRQETERLDCEYRIRNNADEYIWVRDRAVAVRDEAGKAVRLIGLIQDITEETKQKQALADADAERDRILAEFDTVLEAIDYGIMFLDADLNARFVNRTLRDMWGMDEAFIATRPSWTELMEYNRNSKIYDFEGEAWDAFVAERTALLLKGTPEPVELSRADGSILQVQFVVLPDGGRMVTYLDVTKFKKLEMDLRASDHRYEEVMRVVGEGVYDWNIIEDTTYYSPAVSEMLGLEPGTLLNDPNDWLARVHMDDVAHYRQTLLDTFRERRPNFILEYRFHRSDGALRWARQRGVVYYDEQGKALRVVGSTGDVTAEIEMQEKLIHAEKMASLGQLTAGIAHEIKNPLNFVNNFAKLSGRLLAEFNGIVEPILPHLGEDDREDADDLLQTVTENLNKIEAHGRRADAIVRNMLAHSREGPGDIHPFDLNAMLSESLNLAYHGARAENPNFNVTMLEDYDSGIELFEGYQQELSRVFINLFTNGFYATEKRAEASGEDFAPTIKVASRQTNKAIEITVRDNGTGMPADVRSKIFEPFFTTKPTGEGTGLGLSLSFDIIAKQHGGEFDVDSEEGEFTEFRIVLPTTNQTNFDRRAAE